MPSKTRNELTPGRARWMVLKGMGKCLAFGGEGLNKSYGKKKADGLATAAGEMQARLQELRRM